MGSVFNELDGIEKGDWIRFYKNGTLVIGSVQYMYRNTVLEKYAATDVGSVNVRDIFETRKCKAL